MPITSISLGVRSSPGRDTAAGAARLVNCYAEDAGEEGKIRFPVYACDGFEAFSTISGTGTGTLRGNLALTDTALYVVSSARVVKVSEAGAASILTGKSATVTITIASPGVVTWTGHGLKAGASVVFSTTGALPTGITAGTTYYVLTAGLATDSFRISATPEGTVVNTSGSQSGTHTATTSNVISTSGRVTMARNRKEPNAQIGIVTSDGHFYVVENDTVVDYTGLITSLGSTGTLVSITAIDGYFILFFDNGEFFVSSIDEGGVIDTLDFAKAESNPDGGLRNMARGRELILGGPRSLEFWTNTGATDFPFERQASTDIGVYAPASMVALIAIIGDRTVDTIAWAATNSEGAYAGVMLLDGTAGQKISTHAVDRAIRDETDASTIKGFTWSAAGHTFYVITGSTFTWAYDTVTGLWHERVSSALSRWRINDCIAFAGKNIVSDYTLAKLYEMGPGLYDASNASVVTMKHSNDNANTWLVTRTKTLSGSSDLKQRVRFNRCGQSKEDGKVFQVSISYAVMEDGTANSMTIQPPTVHAWPFRMRFYGVFIDTIPGGSQTSRPKGVTGLAVNAVQLAS
jgi:hypothetical protein